MDVSEKNLAKKNQKFLKNWKGAFMITEVYPERPLYRLSTSQAAPFEKIETHNLISEKKFFSLKEGANLLLTLIAMR